MDRYTYQPLDSAEGEIRLFRLLPGSFSDDIEIDIFHARSRFKEEEHKESKSRKLSDAIIHPSQGIPLYEALSYVWGSEAEPSFVTVRRSSRYSPGCLSVTQNLAEALRYLRKENEDRILWVDAICINQEDLAERGVQVGRMGDIYRNATQVDVWLGPGSVDSEVAVNLVHSITVDLVRAGPEERAQWGEDAYTVLPGSETARLFADSHELYPKFSALTRLCRRRWFTRLWIYQEFHLSRAAIAFVGRRTFDVRDLYNVISFLYSLPGDEQSSTTILRVRNVLKPRPWGGRGVRPSKITWVLKHSLCSDERDRVYAILGLLSDEFRTEIVPDYSKSIREVYKDFFICELKSQKVVSLQGSEDEYEDDSPSWAPNLSPKLTKLDTFRASERSKHEIIYEKADESLRLPAKAIGTIAEIWFTTPDAKFTPEILGVFRACAPRSMAESPYPQGGNKLDAYIYSLAGGRCEEVSKAGRHPSVAEIHELIQGGDFSDKKCVKEIGSNLESIRGRAIFSTCDGLIGMCPSTVKVGDKIYVTLGVDRPLLLSGVEDMPKKYRLKGECYVHGFTNSEAFLGPLPVLPSGGVWSYEMKFVQGSFEMLYRTGGVMTQNDPRLGPLTRGWKKIYHKKGDKQPYETEFDSDGTMRRLRFQHISTGKAKYSDPRMTSSALKERGVVFEDIIII
jgi:hypothetical protein